MPDSVTSNRLIAVEGIDEINFVCALLQHIGVDAGNVQLKNVGGKDMMPTYLPALCKTRGFCDVEIFAVIRDADNNSNAAFTSVRNILRRQGLTPPTVMNTFSSGDPNIGIFIMPGNSDNGMLEDLCLETVVDQPAYPCTHHFSLCCQELPDPPRTIQKTMAMPHLVTSVGLAA